MVSCTGCSVVIDGVALPGTGGGSNTPFLTKTIIGQGVGAFSGITNFNLGTVEFYYGPSKGGECTGFSGRLQAAVSVAQSGTGIFTWNAGTYVCTGARPCVTQISQKFIPHPLLSGIAPNFYAWFLTVGAEGSFDLGQITAGQTHTTPVFPSIADCGFADYIFNEIRFGLAPYSGYIGTEMISTINCLPCIVGP